MTKARLRWLLAGWVLLASPALAGADLTAKIDSYFQPYADSGAFSGAVLVTQDGGIVFDKAYGLADAGHQLPNKTTTSFHLGSLSALYTATAVTMLVDAKRLWLTNTVAQFVPGVANGDRITIGDLLAKDPRTDPAAYGLLNRIVEANTGKPLADVFDRDFFGPLFMHGSGLDDGAPAEERRMAKGYVWSAAGGIKPAAPISQAGTSAYTTTRDQLRWSEAFFSDRLITSAARQALLAASSSGWSRSAQSALGATVLEGGGPGFSAVIVHRQTPNVTVIVLSNREAADATSQIGVYLARLAIRDQGGQLPPVVGP